MSVEMTFPGLTVELLPERDVAVVALRGRLPGEHRPDVEEAFLEMIRQGCRGVVVDLLEATYVSETGVGLLIHYHGSVGKKGVQMAVVKPRDEAAQNQLPANLDRYILFCASREEAVAAVRRAAQSPEAP